jgi:hypothetical protein
MEIILRKYPSHVVFQIANSNVKVLKTKFLISRTKSWLSLYLRVRQNIATNDKAAIYIFIHNRLPSLNCNIGTIYDQHKNDQTKLCLITVLRENTFGYINVQ